jgi:hypothetical protein
MPKGYGKKKMVSKPKANTQTPKKKVIKLKPYSSKKRG